MKIFSAVVLICVLVISSPSLRAQRYCCEGETWLNWSVEHRNSYVKAYIRGYYAGYFHGCREGVSTKPVSGTVEPGSEDSRMDSCLTRRLDLTKGIDLSASVTEFYKHHPENRNLLIEEILDELGKGRSIQDIHDNPPFPPIKATNATSPGLKRR